MEKNKENLEQVIKEQEEGLLLVNSELEKQKNAECTVACGLRFEAVQQKMLVLGQDVKDAKQETTFQKRKIQEWRRQHKHLLRQLQAASDNTHKLPRPERDQRFWALVTKEVKFANEKMASLARPRLITKNAKQLARELATSEKTNETMELELTAALRKYEKLKKEHQIAIQRLEWHSQSLSQGKQLKGNLWQSTEDIVMHTKAIDKEAIPAGPVEAVLLAQGLPHHSEETGSSHRPATSADVMFRKSSKVAQTQQRSTSESSAVNPSLQRPTVPRTSRRRHRAGIFFCVFFIFLIYFQYTHLQTLSLFPAYIGSPRTLYYRQLNARGGKAVPSVASVAVSPAEEAGFQVDGKVTVSRLPSVDRANLATLLPEDSMGSSHFTGWS